MPRYSTIRFLYTSTVQVMRLSWGGGQPLIEQGALNSHWAESTEIADRFLGIPGLLKCKIDIQFVRPGLNAPPPEESASIVPRSGTIFYDVPPTPQGVKAGDHLRVIKGAYVGSLFEITAIPEAAQDMLGPIHMEAQIVEKGIDTDLYPQPGEILR